MTTKRKKSTGAHAPVRKRKPAPTSAWRSPVAWLTTVAGGSGVFNAVGTDPTVTALWSKSSTWYGIGLTLVAALIAYFHWRNATGEKSW